MLQVVVDGLSNVIIAERLNITVTTVKHHGACAARGLTVALAGHAVHP